MDSVSSKLPTKYGEFIITIYPAEKGLESVVLSTPKLDVSKPVLVRIHDECMTGDTFGSFKCDCGEQKEKSLQMIAESTNGLFIYMRQEGRGIGLYEKIKAYALQDDGYDTHEANIKLGHKPDDREYTIAKDILFELGIKEILLITNNPYKVNEITKLGIKVIERIPLIISSNIHNENYIETKRVKFQHTFSGDKNGYFIGVNGVENTTQVEDIANSVKGKNSLVKIFISNDTLDLHSLSDEKILSKTKEIFTTIEKFDDLVPVLHYSFKHSVEPKNDLEIIKDKMPYIKYIQLDDLKDNYIEILKYTTNHYSVMFPLTNGNFDLLLDNKEFVDIVVNKKIPILLDNSCGKGIRESSEKYKEKILKCLNKGINNIALAGGFSPDYLDTYFEMVDYFKINLSIDSATGLQSNGVFDVEKTKKYIDNVLAQKYL
jgi:GTP cyclohydrolase II